MLDIRRKAKNANRKAARNKGGSCKISQVLEIAESVERSNIPLGVGANLELIEILLRYDVIKW